MKKHFFSPIPITKLNFYILISISLLPIFHILVKIILKVGLRQRFYFIIQSGKQIGDQTLVPHSVVPKDEKRSYGDGPKNSSSLRY